MYMVSEGDVHSTLIILTLSLPTAGWPAALYTTIANGGFTRSSDYGGI